MIDIKTLIIDLFYCKFDLQKYINRRYQDPSNIIIKKDVVDYIRTKDGLNFYPFDPEIISLVLDEYKFDDIRHDDIVLDLGANIGAFTLRAAQKCKHVYAVEPLYHQELRANINLNEMQDKITILPLAIGDGNEVDLKYRGKNSLIMTVSLDYILSIVPEKVTFLKCDIEGAEWSIRPESLNGIRRIELEAHLGNGLSENVKLIQYIKDNYRYSQHQKYREDDGYFIHAVLRKGGRE